MFVFKLISSVRLCLTAFKAIYLRKLEVQFNFEVKVFMLNGVQKNKSK